jgi:hypothetical protein
MDNIYGQSEQEMNSSAYLPDGFAEKSGNTLYSWLGSLWRGLHEGDGMVRGLQSARGIRLAQLYLNILEAAKLQDRRGAPVFHRELWHPIVVRRSMRNKSQDNLLVVGEEGVVGPQTSEEPYGIGTVLEIGKMGAYKNHVTYPIGQEIAGGALTIVDNIVNPKVFMQRDVDFVIRNNSIIFHVANDPLGEGSAFNRYDLPGVIDEDGKKVADMEAVLWASDVLIDRNFVSDHISYALGANAPSSAVVKRILNAAWDSVSCGLTPELVRTLIAAMLNIPVIQTERETVVDITSEDNFTTVITDRGEYRISPKARLVNGLHIGSVLRKGDFLDESVRIYQNLNTQKKSPFSVPIEQDIPSVQLPPSLLRAKTEYGVYAMWGQSVVKSLNGRSDRLYFDVGGTESDVESFWEGIWKSAEENGVKMESLIGSEGSVISPAWFFLRHLVGANTIFVVVDKSQIDDASMMRNPMFFDMLSDVVPSAMRLFLVEHSAVGSDMMDLGDAEERSSVVAALPRAVECVTGGSVSGKASSFGEHISVKFVRPSPIKTRGRKEEENEN